MSGANLFVGTEDLGVFLSTNNGASWNGTNLTNTDIQTLSVFGTSIFAGTPDAIFVSTDNGASWAAVNDGSTGLPNDSVKSLAFSGTNLFAGSYDGIFLSTNEGAGWTAANSGLPGDVQSFAVLGMNVFAGTNGGVFLSSDNGTSWASTNSGLADLSVRILLVSGASIYAGTLNGGVYLSTNNGASWTAVNSGLTDFHVTGLAMGGTYLYAATSGGGVFRSPTNVIQWTPCNSGITTSEIKAIGASDTNVYVATDSSVYLSTDNGANWNTAETGLPSGTDVLCFAIDSIAGAGNNIFAGTNGKGVFLSTDGGASWHDINTGMSNTTVLTLTFNGTTLFAGTDRGVWSLTVAGLITAVKRDAKEIPNRFSLSQNYPNPFNPTTMISYQLPVNSLVTLKVYDVLGREVATLVNGRQSAGYHHISFNGANLSSGVYFYRLETGSYTNTKKFLLLK